MKRIKTAVVGIGFIGVAHIDALRRLGNVDVVAISDTYNIEEKAKKLYVEKAYIDYKEMIQECELDFIHICTPNKSHFEIASFAMKHGVNVILEKPLTFSLNEAEKLVTLEKQYNLKCAVNFHNRFYPATNYIKSIIAKGTLGTINAVSGSYLQDWLQYDTDYSWRLDSNVSGKTRSVLDVGSHWLDLVEYTTGLKIVAVNALFSTVHPIRKKAKGVIEAFSTKEITDFEEVTIDTEDTATIMFEFENGGIGNCILSQVISGKKNHIELLISGSEKTAYWTLDALSNVEIGNRNTPNEIITKDQLLMKESISLMDYPVGHMEGFPDAFKQVFKQVYNNQENTFYATFQDGLRQMILNEKIFESAQKRAWVTV